MQTATLTVTAQRCLLLEIALHWVAFEPLGIFQKAVLQGSTVLWVREVAGVLWKNVGYAHQATFQGSLTFQGIGYKERGEGKGCDSYVDDFGCTLVALLGGNPPGSVPKPLEGHSNLSRNTFSLTGEAEGGERFPQIKLRRGERADKGTNA